MLEYIFFHKSPFDQFIHYLDKHTVPYSRKDDHMGFVIAIPDDLSDQIYTKVDDTYEKLLSDSEKLLAEQDNAAEKNAAAITINLSDGKTIQASVPPDLLNRILESISCEELGVLVNAIVSSVENPDNRPLCQR